MVAHFVRDEGVAGSNPVIPILKPKLGKASNFKNLETLGFITDFLGTYTIDSTLGSLVFAGTIQPAFLLPKILLRST